jgi:hypothetical protein
MVIKKTFVIIGSPVKSIPENFRKPKPAPKNRQCSYPGCITVLNIYNKRTTCYRHTDFDHYQTNLRGIRKNKILKKSKRHKYG